MRSDRILILGGTRDAREIADELVAAGRNVVTSLAGVTEQPVLPSGEVRVGGFGGVVGLKSYLESGHIGLVIDATHPFAARMSVQAFEACHAIGVLLIRFERSPWVAGEDDDWTYTPSAAEAASAVPSGARVLFDRQDISGIARMIEASSVAPPCNWQILRERPPFSFAGELTLMSENAVTHLVTKNAGGTSTKAKLLAARERKIPVFMINRPSKPVVRRFGAIGKLVSAVGGVLSP
ncbi:MAG: precorrin-6A/cobalt-precorrin-6A reductase [Alphaproteobacteria bacterium]|nr:precorrin-6A/cobalt-precorrin-6A reductase [Alphaproteobacteria bacterium]